MKIRAALVAIVLGMSACQNMPEPYAPPVQRQPLEDLRPRFVPVIDMAAADARKHFVQDISDKLEGSWRWCQQRPAVTVTVPSNEKLKYTIDFTVPEATFKDTGPVTLSFYVNDHLLDRVRYSKPGPLHFEKQVPAGWITPAKDNILAAEIDKMWVSKEDGSRLGFILTRIGLTQ